MKKKLSYIVLALSMLLPATMVPAFAYAEKNGTSTTTTSGSGTSSSTETETEIHKTATTTPPPTGEAPEVETDDASRKTRIEEIKKETKTTLTEVEKTRIGAHCETAQGFIKGKTTSNAAVTKARLTAYGKIVTELQALSVSLSAKNVDVTTLDANIIALQAKITAFSTANTTYQQALTDLGALDCKADPVAFKAALTTVRSDQDAVAAVAKAIRSYIKDTVKPTLQALKTAAGASN